MSRAPLQAAKALALMDKGIRLVAGDLSDGEALARAAGEVDAVFGLSVPFGAGGKEQEERGEANRDPAQHESLPDVRKRWCRPERTRSSGSNFTAAPGRLVS